MMRMSRIDFGNDDDDACGDDMVDAEMVFWVECSKVITHIKKHARADDQLHRVGITHIEKAKK